MVRSSVGDVVCFRSQREGKGKQDVPKKAARNEEGRLKKEGIKKIKSYQTIQTMHYRGRSPHTLEIFKNGYKLLVPKASYT